MKEQFIRFLCIVASAFLAFIVGVDVNQNHIRFGYVVFIQGNSKKKVLRYNRYKTYLLE